MPSITEVAAGKPSATRRGAATAAGVPKPAAPSMKDPKSQATITIWTRRSSLTAWKERLMAATPPERSSVCNSRIAPKMMNSRSKVIKSPSIEAAATREGVICHAMNPTATAAT